MNKAGGTVCSTVSDRRKTVYSDFPSELLSSAGTSLHTVGRLDADTEGLLIFTNDGKLSNFLTRPENKIRKVYFVRLLRKLSPAEQDSYKTEAEKGVSLPPEKKFGVQQGGSAQIEWICGDGDSGFSDSCKISVTEGKFHEVKRIFRALGNEVVYLKRIEFATICLDENLAPGAFRALSEDEVRSLEALTS